MGRSLTGRSDLVESLRRGDQPLMNATAALLDFETIETHSEPEELPPIEKQPDLGQRTRHKSAGQQGDGAWTQFDPLPPRYWQLVDIDPVVIDDPTPRVDTRQDGDQPWRARPKTVPVIEPLASKRQLLTRLRQSAGVRTVGNRPDIPALVDQVSRCELLDRIPFQQFRVWGTSLHVIQDRSRRLTPCWSDQDQVCRILQAIYPSYSLTVSRVWDQLGSPQVLWPESRRGVWQHPPATTSLLILGDLGSLSVLEDERESIQDHWRDLGRECQRAGNRAMALLPCRPDQVPRELGALWNTIPWESGPSSTSDPDALDQLLTLVSPAVRLEPGLLREIRRRALKGGYGNPGLESLLWQHDALSSQHSVAASFDPESQKALRAQFDAIADEELRHDVLTLIRDWRGKLHEAIWFEEILGLDESARDWFATDFDDALHMMRRMTERVWQGPDGPGDWPTWVSWARGVLKRIPADLWRDQEIGEALHAIHEAVKDEDETDVSPGFQPARVKPNSDRELITLDVHQQGDSLLLAPHNSTADVSGNRIGSIRTRNGKLRVSADPPSNFGQATDPVDTRNQFWESKHAPAWAHDWGTDKTGAWCSFQIKEVEQRLRWIPAGTFLVGSPDEEEGRYSDEGPQHDVTLSNGYWIFDTPCTQALWEAVTGENPSKFKGPARPVEQVSWQDCKQFLKQLNQHLPGLELRLPTEAEWEYACRAGSDTAQYGELDSIAWYAKNSDSESHDVASKQPNAWGVYDMLGNVWEWCEDHSYRPYVSESVVDPRFSKEDSGADRVIRGGCWGIGAQVVRAAYRFGYLPGARWNDLGFRCLSSSPPVQPVQPGREAAVSGSGLSVAEQRDRESEQPPRGARKKSILTRVKKFFSKD
jgi:formylglycine-generating enzyme required for sulfatase activity